MERLNELAKMDPEGKLGFLMLRETQSIPLAAPAPDSLSGSRQ